jgi:hypothetical protein
MVGIKIFYGGERKKKKIAMIFLIVLFVVVLLLIYCLRFHSVQYALQHALEDRHYAETHTGTIIPQQLLLPFQWRLLKHCWTSFPDQYARHVQQGKTKARQSSIVVAGLLHLHFKDIRPFFDSFWIPLLWTHFQNFHIVLCMTGSTQTSLEAAREWARDWNKKIDDRPHISILAPSFLPTTVPMQDKGSLSTAQWRERVEIMCTLRNYLWTYCASTFSSFDILFMMDPDLTGEMPLHGFFHGVHMLLHETEGVYAVGCNTYTPEYTIFDTFPLVPQQSSFRWNGTHDKKEHDRIIQQRWKHHLIWNRIRPFPVWSTFNGCVLYKINAVFDTRQKIARFQYQCHEDASYNDNNNNDDDKENLSSLIRCEHVQLHLSFPSGSVILDPLWLFALEKNWN